jgi:hypothetical protein
MPATVLAAVVRHESATSEKVGSANLAEYDTCLGIHWLSVTRPVGLLWALAECHPLGHAL